MSDPDGWAVICKDGEPELVFPFREMAMEYIKDAMDDPKLAPEAKHWKVREVWLREPDLAAIVRKFSRALRKAESLAVSGVPSTNNE